VITKLGHITTLADTLSLRQHVSLHFEITETNLMEEAIEKETLLNLFWYIL
jgi:hypothetical protein